MDINTLRIAATLLSFATFAAIAAWAYSGRNAARFEADGHIPFGED